MHSLDEIRVSAWKPCIRGGAHDGISMQDQNSLASQIASGVPTDAESAPTARPLTVAIRLERLSLVREHFARGAEASSGKARADDDA